MRKRLIAILTVILMIMTTFTPMHNNQNVLASEQSSESTYNGDFEKGNLSGWRNDGGENSLTLIEGKYKTGNFIGQSTRGQENAGDNFWGLSYRFDVIENSEYDFSAAIKAQNVKSAIIKVDWIDDKGNYFKTDYILGDTDGNIDWTKYGGTFTAPVSAKYGELRVLYKVPYSGAAYVWVDDACAALRPETPSSVINGDFEDGTLNYWNADGNFDSASVIKDEEKNSFMGLSTRTDENISGGTWWGLHYKLKVGSQKDYYFSADVKTENTNDAHIKIDWLDETGNNIGNTFIRGGLTGNNNWDTYVGSVTVPENVKYAELKFLQAVPGQKGTTAKLYVDNVEFSQQGNQHEATINGDFELGNLNNWIVQGTGSAQAVSGKYQAGNYIGESLTGDGSAGSYGLKYLKTTAPGSIYKFSAALKTENAKGAAIKIDWYDNAGNNILTNSVSDALQGTNEWRVYENYYTAPLKSGYAVISFSHSRPETGEGKIYVDDMNFYPDPLINGDFEKGNLFKWEVSGKVKIVEGGYRTGKYMALSERDASDTKAYWSGLNYYVSVDPDKRYEFSSVIKTENAREAHVKITWLDSNKNPIIMPGTTNKYLTDYLLETPLNGDNDWTLVSKYFTPPKEARYAIISFCHENPKQGTGKLYIDNVYFKEFTAEEMYKYFKYNGGKAKILFTASPSGAFGGNFPALDDKYAIELYNQNYTAASTNYWYSSPLEETNVLSYGVAYPDRLPFVNEKYELYESKNPTISDLKKYVTDGGGLLINMGYAGYGDQAKVVENINNFLSNFGAELVWQKVTDDSHKEIYNNLAKYTYYSTSNMMKTELTNDVSKIWYPGGKDNYTVTSYSMKTLDDSWTVDVKAEETAKPKADDGTAPILMAHRTYGKGRIVILTMDPRYGVASGSHEAYGGYILGDNADDKKLYRNIYDWLGEPTMEQGRVFKKANSAPELKEAAAVKPAEEVTDSELNSKLNDPGNEMVNLNQYKGIVGVQSNFSGGENTVEELSEAAVSKGYNFLVFAEDYNNMSEEKYNALVEKCSAINNKYSGFRAIPGLKLPPAAKDIEPRYYGKGVRVVFNLKRWPTVEEATSPEWYTLLFNQSWPSVILSQPDLNENNPWQLMFYTGLAVETYDGNKKIDDAAKLYRKLVSSDYRLIPTVVSYILSVDELNEYNGSVTYVYSKNPDEIKNNMQTFGGSGTSYVSAGPQIKFKYASAKTASYAGSGEEIFTNQKFTLNIEEKSDNKLKEVTLYRDTEVYRKYYPDSDNFKTVLYLTKDANHAFTVETTDIYGNKAVSNSVRTGSPYQNFTMCTDKQNVIQNFYGKEGSDGIIQSFWLSGKDLGQLYINKSSFDIAPAGEDASWAAASVVESLPKAWTKNSPLGGDDPEVSTVSSRCMRLSSDDAVVIDSTISDDIFKGYTRYTTFRPKLQGDNILMVEGNYKTKKQVTLGDTTDNLETILFRVMGNYAHEPFKIYVYSPDYNTKISGTMEIPESDTGKAFIPVPGSFKLSEGGYLGMWSSKTGNIMMFPLGTEDHDISFGMTNSRRVFEESGSETYRNYLAYGFHNPGQVIPKNTSIHYKLLFVIDNGKETNEAHADEIRSAYRLGASEGIEADVTNGKVTNNKYTLNVDAEDNYTILNLNKRYMPNDILPIIVNKTEQNWDSAEYDYYTQSFRKISGFDKSLYSAVDISERDRKLFIGNPITATDSSLKINFLKDDNGEIKVEVQNPTNSYVNAGVYNSAGLKNVISLNYQGTWAPGETKELNVEAKTVYSFECSGPVNVAVNAKVTSDSSDAGNLPEKAIDNLNYTKWQSSDSSGNHWLELELDKEYKIDRFVIKHAGAGMESPQLNTKDFNIQYLSEETGEWINIVTVEGNNKNVTVHDINPIKTKHTRLLIKSANSIGGNTAIIYGFEVYTTYIDVSGRDVVRQVIPEAPVINGVADGQTANAVTPYWTSEKGMESNAVISKDGRTPFRITSGTKIDKKGKYVLTVNVVNPENGMVSVSKINFDIKKYNIKFFKNNERQRMTE